MKETNHRNNSTNASATACGHGFMSTKHARNLGETDRDEKRLAISAEPDTILHKVFWHCLWVCVRED